MSARDDILGKVRANLQRGAKGARPVAPDLGAVIGAHQRGPRPAFPDDAPGLLARFIER